MKKEFTAWTKRVDNIELQLNANSSVRQLIPDEDYLSVHPTASPFTSEEVDVPHGNGAIEAPLAGAEPPLANVGSDYSHSNVSKERLDNHGPDQSCEFFRPRGYYSSKMVSFRALPCVFGKEPKTTPDSRSGQ